jgi:hypothetical protein
MIDIILQIYLTTFQKSGANLPSGKSKRFGSTF